MHNISTWVIGNWKMNGTASSSDTLAASIIAGCKHKSDHVEVVICPPAIWLPRLKNLVGQSVVKLGGQDCHGEASGAYTGNISAPMLVDAGCAYVIIGHSERRQHQHETSEEISKKASKALENGLIPIICVGETARERAEGKALKVVEAQIAASLPKGKNGDLLLAYEPVWAIGSGQIPGLEDIRQMHRHIMGVVAQKTGVAEGKVHVLYGGSVNAANSGGILGLDEVAGVLVGGASLKADEFCGIIAAAAA